MDKKRILVSSMVIAGMFLGCFIIGAGAQKVTLDVPVMMGWRCIQPAIDRVGEFEAAHPGVKVKIYEFPFFELLEKQYIEAASQAGKFDLAQVDHEGIPTLMASGMIYPLNDFIKEKYGSIENWKKRFFPLIRVGIDEQGNILFVPFHANIRYGIYRKDLFDKYGYEPPRTFEELRDIAKSLTRDIDGDGRVDLWGLTMMGEYRAAYFTYFDLATSMGMVGPEVLDEKGRVRISVEGSQDREAAIKAAKFLQDMIFKYKAMPPNTVQIGHAQQWEMWKKGQIAMSISWWGDYWTDPLLRSFGEVGSFAHPTLPGVTRAQWGSWWTEAVWKLSDNPKMAFEFIDWLLSKDLQDAMSKGSGQASPIKDYTEEYVRRGWVAPALPEAFERASSPPHTPEFPAISEAFRTELARLLTNEITPKQMVDNVAKKLVKVMK